MNTTAVLLSVAPLVYPVNRLTIVSVCIFQNGSEYELAAVLFLCSEFLILEANSLDMNKNI